MAQEIVIDIDAVGNVKVEGKGIEGMDCKALTKELEAALGDVQQVRLKPEYHRPKAHVRKVGA
jgi:hypothetical protein